MNPEASLSSSKKGLIFSIILVIAIIVVVYFVTRGREQGGNGGSPQFIKENVNIHSVNLATAKTEKEKIPPGFPSLIPIETTDAYESYSMEYPDRGATQYTISYKTDSTVSAKYKEYLDFMTKNGFEFGPDGKNESAGALYGTKDDDDLSVVISRQTAKTSVQVSYLDRK